MKPRNPVSGADSNPHASGLRVVAINLDPAYLALLAGLPHRFTVIERGLPGRPWAWDEGIRPVPANVTLAGLEEASGQAAASRFDVALVHSLTDLLTVADLATGRILLIDRTRQECLRSAEGRLTADQFTTRVLDHLERIPAKVAFTGDAVARSWIGLPGRVMPCGIPAAELCGYTGELPAVLRVPPPRAGRDPSRGDIRPSRVLRGIPTTRLGAVSAPPAWGSTACFDALLEAYRSHRCFLLLDCDRQAEGQSLASLEAMATGMPVVTTPQPGSPVRHRREGLIGRSEADLRRHVSRLLHDRDLAADLGAGARARILERYRYRPFLEAWEMILGQAAGRPAGRVREREAEPVRPVLTVIPGGRP